MYCLNNSPSHINCYQNMLMYTEKLNIYLTVKSIEPIRFQGLRREIYGALHGNTLLNGTTASLNQIFRDKHNILVYNLNCMFR